MIAALLLAAAPAFATGVSPATVNLTGNPGQSFTINKTVATPAIPPRPDVFFLADTTGSMGGAIGNVRAGAAAIMNAVIAAQPDAQFGVGNYKDGTQQPCGPDPYAYQLDQVVTANTAAVQAAINTWSAGGGCDTPESQLFALTQVAGGSSGFRTGSTRIVVWFGDAPGHDPDLGATQSSTITALQAAGIKVIAISTGANQLDSSGQATAITNATGGVFRSGVDDSAVTAAILDGLQNLPVTVSRQISCNPGLTLTLNPTSPETLTSGGNVTYSELVTISPGNPGGVTLHCTVTFLLNGQPADGFTETVNITVNGADLRVVKTGPALVTEGQTYTYTLTATNNGPAAATGVVVSDPLPANTTFVSASPGCSFAAGTVTCVAGNLAPAASAVFTVQVRAGSAGTTITNTATVTGAQSDPNPANNTSTVQTRLNHNPVCTAVKANPPTLLWPPNHTLRPVTVSGATDPDGNPLTYTVTGVTQDEPTNGLGDGDTAPDAVLGSGPNLQVRAERSGTGDGRVYRIAVTVSDGQGGSCTAVASVGVPHDQGGSPAPVDSGGVYNSLV